MLNILMIRIKNANRTVFYPCCGMDINDPISLIKSEKLNFIFCDIKSYRNWRSVQTPDIQVNFLKMDAWEAISKLPKIDILFYRRDGMSEGGSGVQVLGEQYLEKLLLKFPSTGGSIITDGSNTSQSYLNKLFSSNVECMGYKLSLSTDQAFVSLGLKTLNVEKL